jgi:hypothetical protein
MKNRHLHGIPDDVARVLGIRNYPGYMGSFTRRQADGAIPNGTVIVKIAVDEGGDIHPIGTRGAVLGSIRHPTLGYFYFIEWDPRPGLASGCQGYKIKALE